MASPCHGGERVSIWLKFEIVFAIGWLVLALGGWLTAFLIRLPFPRRMRGPFLLILSHVLGAVVAIVALFIVSIAVPQLRANGFNLAAAACVQPGLLAADLARHYLKSWWKWLGVLLALGASVGLARLNVNAELGRERLMARAAMSHFAALELRDPMRSRVYDALGTHFGQRRAEILNTRLPELMQQLELGNAPDAREIAADIMAQLWTIPFENPAPMGQAPEAALVKLVAARRAAFERLANRPDLCVALLLGQQNRAPRGAEVSAEDLQAVGDVQIAAIEAAAAGRDKPAGRDPRYLDSAVYGAVDTRLAATLTPQLHAASRDPAAQLLLPPPQRCEVGRRWTEAVAALPPAGQAQIMANNIAGNLPVE